MEQAAGVGHAPAAAICKDEFDFIAFDDLHPAGSTTSLNIFPTWLYINKGRYNGVSVESLSATLLLIKGIAQILL